MLAHAKYLRKNVVTIIVGTGDLIEDANAIAAEILSAESIICGESEYVVSQNGSIIFTHDDEILTSMLEDILPTTPTQTCAKFYEHTAVYTDAPKARVFSYSNIQNRLKARFHWYVSTAATTHNTCTGRTIVYDAYGDLAYDACNTRLMHRNPMHVYAHIPIVAHPDVFMHRYFNKSTRFILDDSSGSDVPTHFTHCTLCGHKLFIWARVGKGNKCAHGIDCECKCDEQHLLYKTTNTLAQYIKNRKVIHGDIFEIIARGPLVPVGFPLQYVLVGDDYALLQVDSLEWAAKPCDLGNRRIIYCDLYDITIRNYDQ